MQSQVRDMYIGILEKRAAEAAAPDYSTDSQSVANGEVAANNKDQRSQLEGLFAMAKPAEKQMTSQINKLLPIAKKTPDTMARNPLLKIALQVAHHQAFFNGIRRASTGFFKTAELGYLRVSYRSFEDELLKVANLAAQMAKITRQSGKAKMLGSAAKDAPWGIGKTLRGTSRGKPGTVTFPKAAGSFTPESAIRMRQAEAILPENSDPSQTTHRSASR